ncbi:MAG: pseudouridine-5'-phosphate glycosidase [Pyrinomonadaceae bacterium]
MLLKISEEIREALANNAPVVALESTVIAHGLPYPHNIETAFALEEIIRNTGAIPATIAVLNGLLCVGLKRSELEFLATSKSIRKASIRDLPIAVAKELPAATTVATTTYIANLAGIRIFATGGIGGVHRGASNDVSADLPTLAQTSVAVVCSGAKIVLDLSATREWLETNGVTILGFESEEFAAFYSRSSGLPVDERVNSAEEAGAIINAARDLKTKSAILVSVPIPEEFEVEPTLLQSTLESALGKASAENITGKNITPFLLSEMVTASIGKTLEANIALLKNNAKVAAKIAKYIY